MPSEMSESQRRNLLLGVAEQKVDGAAKNETPPPPKSR